MNSKKIAFHDNGERKESLRNVRRIVVKVGTRLLTTDNDSKEQRIQQLISNVSAIRDAGIEVILVSSGAIGAGMSVLETATRPTSLPRLQAHAAVGQSRLMYLYETACTGKGFHCAQMLLTKDDVEDRERHLNVISCLDALLDKGVLPIVNENDSVRVEEIQFGDNDTLAASVGTMARADLTILLTSVDGLRISENGTLGSRCSVVKELSDEVREWAGESGDSHLAVGGMRTKLEAADILARAGEYTWVADGTDFSVLSDIIQAKDIGTVFIPGKNSRMQSYKRYLAFFSECAGEIIVDSGAARALAQKGRSLLPSGVIDCKGEFSRGSTVRVVDSENHEVARGITNYSTQELLQIKGLHTAKIHQVLGYAAYGEIMHRNYLAITCSSS